MARDAAVTKKASPAAAKRARGRPRAFGRSDDAVAIIYALVRRGWTQTAAIRLVLDLRLSREAHVYTRLRDKRRFVPASTESEDNAARYALDRLDVRIALRKLDVTIPADLLSYPAPTALYQYRRRSVAKGVRQVLAPRRRIIGST